MQNTPKDTLIMPGDDPTPIASAQTIATPHFDEISIKRARPAVPLVQIRARRFRRLALVLMCGLSVVGAVIGIAVSRYRNRSEQMSSATSVAPEGTSQPESNQPLPQSDGDTEEKANDARPGASEGNAEATRAVHPRESRETGGEPMTDAEEGESRATLNGAFDEWIAATNARDIQRQMNFYSQTVNAFYLTRNVPREAVRAEKSRVFGGIDLIDIQAAEPGIRLSRDGRNATMRFRKKYAIKGGGQDRRGEVVQELRWRRTADGWKIVSERDLRVIH